MARPNKDGVDYFPLDCVFDDEIKYIEAEFGLDGLAMIIKLWQKIYGDKGYYCTFTRTVRLMFSQSIGKGVNFVDEVITRCTQYGIFDREILKKYEVLTSKGIQERYAKMTERRNSLKIDRRYLLISAPQNWVFADNNGVNVDNNSINANINAESKVKRNRNINTTTTREEIETPEENEVATYLREIDNSLDESLALSEAKKFATFNSKRSWSCLPDWKGAARQWASRIRKESKGSFETEEFYQLALKKTQNYFN